MNVYHYLRMEMAVCKAILVLESINIFAGQKCDISSILDC